MPDSAGLELIAHDLRQSIAGSVVDAYCFRDQAALVVEPAKIREVLSWLRSTPGQEYNFMSSLHGADYLPQEPRFAVHYELLNMERAERLRVKAALAEPVNPEQLPAIDSVTDLFPTAEFQEREVYDMFGIEFKGHPDLRRILMPESYAGWPQRRDFPVGGEPVLFTHNTPESPGWFE